LPYLSANRDVAEQALLERLPEIRFLRPEATFLAWLDCTALGLEDAPAAHFLRHGRVALSQGEFFGEDWKGFARLNLATSRTILLEAVERMAKAVGR
jgi:cystathionine beta-lyase